MTVPIRVEHAPDLAEPLLGWRTWCIAELPGGLSLTSVVRDVAWPVRASLDAECLRPSWRWWRRRQGEHMPPERACECGIYAAATVAQALTYFDAYDGAVQRRAPVVLGVVKLWGTVLQCERGWRASHAYPARLFVVAPTKRRDLDPAALAAGLGRYGVPVEVLDTSAGSVVDLLVARDERVTFTSPPLPRGC
jgi:hypothetical protein